ncbi:hypothetical protein BY996DRAFT_6432152 [Phakopsora pachyrhizi]|nr:hypothetical protein BY996DRAFT_6432152 [Phakopsora pachyrhizi]
MEENILPLLIWMQTFVRLKLTNKSLADDPSIADKEKFDSKLNERRQDADEFYSRLNPGGNTGSGLSEELRNIMRQALAGILWNKQFYHFDTAFHCIPLAMVDQTFARNQLWNFSNINPPVQAWETFRVFKIEWKMYGREDLQFLEMVFQKLLLNST